MNILFTGRRWQLQGLCNQSDPEAWYPDKDGDSPIREQFKKLNEMGKPITAKSICRRCPVRPQCLEWALENNEREGIWGGLTAKERARLRKKDLGS